jgi:hypothetical protein
VADTPESKVKMRVKRLLTRAGAYQFWPVQTGYGAATLDCLGFHEGRGFSVETKAPKKKPTVRQQVTADEIQASGAAVFIVDGINGEYERLEAWLFSPPTN